MQHFKQEVSNRGKKQTIRDVYDTAVAERDSDYGHMPRSKKQLKDLSRSSLANNDVADLLA